MRKLLLWLVLWVMFFPLFAQNSDFVSTYIKKEKISGIFFGYQNDREELFTDLSRYFEKSGKTTAKFRFSNQSWAYLPQFQEQWSIGFDAGPFFSKGNLIDSSKIRNVIADQKNVGINLSVFADYARRFYYTTRHYTLIQVNGSANFDVFNQKVKGNETDSNKVTKPLDESGMESKLRYGFKAKAAWGYGRLSPVNHLMISEYILEKYYKGRMFSDLEKQNFAMKIGEIKHKRSAKKATNYDEEINQLNTHLNSKLLLLLPENLQTVWIYGELLPRMNGARFEIGPFFNYYNREPDFIYGGFTRYDLAKYRNYKWNSNIGLELVYNNYKKRDWIIFEANVGWSYFKNLKSQFDFGVKYIPGVVLTTFNNISSIKHSFVPYLGYFTQLNRKSRINLAFAYRITEGEQFMLPGPELKVAIYNSKF